MLPIKIMNCTGVPAATENAAKDKFIVTIAVSRKLLSIDAWLQENYNWSIADWVKHVIHMLTSDEGGLIEGMAEDLEEEFNVPRSLFVENENEIRKLLGVEPIEYDPLNRVYMLLPFGKCSICGHHKPLLQVIEQGFSKLIACYECVRKAGYGDWIH